MLCAAGLAPVVYDPVAMSACAALPAASRQVATTAPTTYFLIAATSTWRITRIAIASGAGMPAETAERLACG